MSYFRRVVIRYGVYFAWLIALVSTLGSLYFSEIKNYIPCELCWYQRIFMYPMVILLGMATYRDDRRIADYALPLTFCGGGIALFHYLIQRFPSLAAASPCKEGVPCNLDYINWFGFITIPLLSLVAFGLMFYFLWNARRKLPNDQ